MIDIKPPQISILAISLLIGGPFACKEPPSPPAQEIHATQLPVITIRATGDQRLLTFHDGGRFVTVDALSKIPRGRRGWVRVVDLKTRPDRRKDGELVYVADFRKAKKNGTFPYVVMSRRAFELAAKNMARSGAADSPQQRTAAAKHQDVILYATSWCGACRAARQFMQEKNIRYLEKDIEKDAAAAAELMNKAKAAGISPSGVPVIDVRGTLMQGFDAQRLMSLLRGD